MMAFLGELGLAESLIVIGAICSVTGSLFLGIKQGKQQLEIKDQIINELELPRFGGRVEA